MSILTGKHVLVVGEETDQISEVEAALITYGASITTTTCQTAEADKIASQGIDLVLLNHQHEGSHCRTLLQALQQARLHKVIPVFALVANDQEHIEDAFRLGAADYITADEDVHAVVDKIKSAFGQGSTDSGESAIDISPQPTVHSSGTKVFVIEDDPLLRNLLAVRFEKSNLPFAVAEDGEGVVEKIQTFGPDIIILDLMLPGKDGFTILHEIKDSNLKDIPVIIFSNKDSQSDRDRAEQMGAAGFYVKAMTDLSELLVVIEKTTQQQPVHSAG